jgi:hypothetical protein
MSCGNGGTYTRSLAHPHRKKSMDVKSGDLGGHVVGPPRPINLLGNVSLRKQNYGSAVEHRPVEKLAFLQSLQEVGAWASSPTCRDR